MNRSVVIDTLKAVASQVIVLHHLTLYAPMTEWLAKAWPDLIAFFYDDGRLAVQPFLVMGGFLTAQSLSKTREQPVGTLLWKRYWRLAPPLGLALLLVVVATVLLGNELSHEDWLSPLPTLGDFLAHLFFLQDILEIPSLSAGAWYVAIDLQLFGLLALVAHFAQKSQAPLSESLAPVIVAFATVASIHFFSREAALDAWGIYYLSAYGMGALAAWALNSQRARMCLWGTAVLLAVDWLSDPRARPLLALLTAFCLYGGAHIQWQNVLGPVRKFVQYLSDVSYSLFVCHFAVIIVFSGIWEKFNLEGVAMASMLVGMAWLTSLAIGSAIQFLCDQSMLRLKSRR